MNLKNLHPYASIGYAQAFEGLAKPVFLPSMGNYALLRSIKNSSYLDAIGCYPFCIVRPDAVFEDDFRVLRKLGVVSLVQVADPGFTPAPKCLDSSFDQIRDFKTLFIHDYSYPFTYTRNHRVNVAKARKDCEVRPVDYKKNIGVWKGLYSYLVETHSITGLQRFSDTYFEKIAQLDGLHAHAAYRNNEIVSMNLWIEFEGVVYGHLTASSAIGRKVRGGYALVDFAIEYFRNRKLLLLGGGSGLVDNEQDGLAVFKQGFSNRTETSKLCCKVINPEVYHELSQSSPQNEFFPAYRSGL